MATEPQGIPEALDGSFRHRIQFSILWARHITILRHSTIEHENDWLPNRKASQKLSMGVFGIKFNSLSFRLAKSRFYDILQRSMKHLSNGMDKNRETKSTAITRRMRNEPQQYQRFFPYSLSATADKAAFRNNIKYRTRQHDATVRNCRQPKATCIS